MYVRMGAVMQVDAKKSTSVLLSREQGSGMLIRFNMPEEPFANAREFRGWVLDTIAREARKNPEDFQELDLDLDNGQVWTWPTVASRTLTKVQYNTDYKMGELVKELRDGKQKQGFQLCVAEKAGMKTGAVIMRDMVETVELNKPERTKTNAISKSNNAHLIERELEVWIEAMNTGRVELDEKELAFSLEYRTVWIEQLVKGARTLDKESGPDPKPHGLLETEKFAGLVGPVEATGKNPARKPKREMDDEDLPSEADLGCSGSRKLSKKEQRRKYLAALKKRQALEESSDDESSDDESFDSEEEDAAEQEEARGQVRQEDEQA